MTPTGKLIIATLVLAGTTTGCEVDAAGPSDTADVEATQAAISAVDVSGDWTFSRELHITAPAWAAELIFGVVPEGKVTHIRCADGGSLNIDQTGSTFTGTASFSGTCRTAGGQVFNSGRPEIVIAEGVVRGRSMEFVWIEDGFLICPYHGVSRGDELSGTGRCIVPGHPQSPVPADPPPAGTSKTVSFKARRN